MKKLVLLVSLGFFLCQILQAQPKPKSMDDTPTKKEMEAMMKEAQQAMDEMSDEDKAMMESMGIKMPTFNSNLGNVTDAQLAQAFEEDSRIVPNKDVARIGSISGTPLTKASMPGFLTSTHSKVILQLKPGSRAKGEEIYQIVKQEYNSPLATGNAAAGLWMMGKVELALYVMGKACLEDPVNSNNLNNYAAMLSMTGGEQLALPILNHINQRFPQNSTILNNIGQAWFGLGDIDKATVYLDSTIRIYAYHPQANVTKSFIEESKGHTEAAKEAAEKSIKEGYTQEKEQRINKQGKKYNGKDLRWNAPMPQDPLGLEKFTWPGFPKNVEESKKLKLDWISFKERVDLEWARLDEQIDRAETAATEAAEQRAKLVIQSIQSGVWMDPMPPLVYKAMAKLGYLVNDNDGHMAYQEKQNNQALVDALLQVAEFKAKCDHALATVKEKYEDSFGEGKSNPAKSACADENSVKNQFLNNANSLLEAVQKDYLQFQRRKINDMIYYSQYTMWPEDFELAKLQAKHSWLGMIKGQIVKFESEGVWCENIQPPKPGPFKLSEFDEVHCEYHSELKTPVGSINTDCSRMTTKLDLKVIKLGLKQDMNKETFGDQFISCTVEVGVSVGAGVDVGPIKAEASVGAGVGVEIDRQGVKDVTVKVSAEVGVGTNIIGPASKPGQGSSSSGGIVSNTEGSSMAGQGIKDVSVSVGVEGQISIISGKSSVESTGLLQGVFKK